MWGWRDGHGRAEPCVVTAWQRRLPTDKGRTPPRDSGRLVAGAAPLPRLQDHAGLWTTSLDGPEDVVKLEFLDFEVQRTLGNVEFARDLSEITLAGLDRRYDGLALHRFETREGESSRSAVGQLPHGHRGGEL